MVYFLFVGYTLVVIGDFAYFRYWGSLKTNRTLCVLFTVEGSDED